MSYGWIKVERSIQDHWLWETKPFSPGQAWIDLLLMAKYKPERFVSRGKVIDGDRGTVYKSMVFFSDRWGWDRKKVRRFLRLLEEDGMVTLEDTGRGTAITIVNYGKFQDQGTEERTPNWKDSGQMTEQQWDSNGTAMGQVTGQEWDTNSPHLKKDKKDKKDKNDKNDKKEKNEKKEEEYIGADAPIPKRFTPPSVYEVSTYCQEQGLDVDADRFVDFYETKGWMVGKSKMKDWKAACRNWARSSRDRPLGQMTMAQQEQKRHEEFMEMWRNA